MIKQCIMWINFMLLCIASLVGNKEILARKLAGCNIVYTFYRYKNFLRKLLTIASVVSIIIFNELNNVPKRR